MRIATIKLGMEVYHRPYPTWGKGTVIAIYISTLASQRKVKLRVKVQFETHTEPRTVRPVDLRQEPDHDLMVRVRAIQEQHGKTVRVEGSRLIVGKRIKKEKPRDAQEDSAVQAFCDPPKFCDVEK